MWYRVRQNDIPISTAHQARCSSRKCSSRVSLSSISFAISVVSMLWSIEHRTFVVETYFKCGDSVIAAQRQFRTHFGVGRHGRVPNRKNILLWIRNFRQTSSALKRKSPGRPGSVQTPENITTVRHAVTTSPQRSAAKHALALGGGIWPSCAENFTSWLKISPIQNNDGPETSRTWLAWKAGCLREDVGKCSTWPSTLWWRRPFPFIGLRK